MQLDIFSKIEGKRHFFSVRKIKKILTQAKHCFALAIDPVHERIFYVTSFIKTQRRGSSIHSTSLTGSDQKFVLSAGLAKVICCNNRHDLYT